MARLFDLIMRDRKIDTRLKDGLKDGLRGTTVIVADNVAEYFWRTGARDRWNFFDDFPNIAPPFDEFFIEYHIPPERLLHTKMGIHFRVLAEYDETPSGVAWSVLAQSYMGYRKAVVGPIVEWKFGVTRSGALLRLKDGNPALGSRYTKAAFYDLLSTEERSNELLEEAERHFILPAFLALSFMHCKNVDLVPNAPPAKLSRKHEKRYGQPLARYYTLEIEPMKKILRTEGQSEKTGLKRALHICRGHFAHYTAERPLFGKVVGTVWRPAHVRGSAKEGVVVKDYAVKGPKDE